MGQGTVGLLALILSAPAFGQSLTTDALDYSRGETLTANWSGASPLTAFSFIAIADTDQPDGEWNFGEVIGFASSGEYTWDHIPQGCDLEIRVYRTEGEVLLRSAPFDVDCGVRDATISTDSPTYFVGDDIEISWTNAAGYGLDWLATATTGSPDSSYLDFSYTDPVGYSGPYDGSRLRSTFAYKAIDNLPPGEYEARLMLNNGFDVQARSEFSVAVDPADPSTITTDRENYTPRTPVEVSWTEAPGELLDWTAIARRALPSTELSSYVDIYGDQTWQYTGGLVDGSHEYPQIKELGQYAARGFTDNTYVPFANQALFTVDFAPGGAPVADAAISVDLVEYYKGQPIDVTFTSATGGPDDLLMLSDSTFAPDDPAGVAAWVYFDQAGLTGSADGVHTFYEFLANGTYVARGMSGDSYTPMGASDVFAVVPNPDTLPAVWTNPTCVAPDAVGIDVFYINVATPPAGVWVGIWDEGADRYSFAYSWDYVPSGTPEGDGFFWFSGAVGVDATLPVGRYEVRLMNSSRRIGYTGFFDVNPACPDATVTADREFYQVGDRIEVSWTGMEDNPEYKVGVFDTALDDAVDDYNSEEFTFTAGSGLIEFDATDPGIYTANGFHQYSRAVVGQSDPFIVCPEGEVPDCTNTCTDETTVRPFECPDTGPVDTGDSGATPDSSDSADSGDSAGDSADSADSGDSSTTTSTIGDSGRADSAAADSGVFDSGSTTGDSGSVFDSGSTTTTTDSGLVGDSGGTTTTPTVDSGFTDSGGTTTTPTVDSGFTDSGDSGFTDSGDSGFTDSGDSGFTDSGGTTTTPTGDSGFTDSGGTTPTTPTTTDSGLVGDSGGTTPTTPTTTDSGLVGDSGGTTTTPTGDSGLTGPDSGGTTTTPTGDSGLTGPDSGGTTTTPTGDSGTAADSGTPTTPGDSSGTTGDSGGMPDSGGISDSGAGLSDSGFPTGDSGSATGTGTGTTGPTRTDSGSVSGDSGATTGDSGSVSADSGLPIDSTTTPPDSGIARDSGSAGDSGSDSGAGGDSGGSTTDSGAGDSGGDSGA